MSCQIASTETEEMFIFYASRVACDSPDCPCRKLQHRIEARFDATEVYRSFRSLLARLRQSGYDIMGLVFVAANESELRMLLESRDLLEGEVLFLVLTDRSPANQALLHRLRPRFAMALSDDHADLIAAMESVYNRYRQSPGLGA